MIAELRAERIKLRRSAAVRMAFVIPTMLVLLDLLCTFVNYATERFARHGPIEPIGAWTRSMSSTWEVWAIVAAMLVALLAASLANLEHAGKHWKQLYAMPRPRWNLFAVKFLACTCLMGVSTIIYGAGMIVVTLVRSSLYDLELGGHIPWGLLTTSLGEVWLGSLAMIAIQTWVTLRYAGYLISVGVATAGLVMIAMASQLKVTGWWPWSMMMDHLPRRDHDAASLWISPLMALVIAIAAAWHLSRREVI